MYWYKKRRYILLAALFTSGLFSCNPDVKVADKNYFDIKGYFGAEAKRLSQHHPYVNKHVGHNHQTEDKRLHINNWQDELGLFSLSDINKPAWRSSYRASTHGDTTIYKAAQSGLKTQLIRIVNNHGHVKSIYIENFTSNMLYNSSEELTYFPDSLYHIHKTQHVRLLGVNDYDITGKF